LTQFQIHTSIEDLKRIEEPWRRLHSEMQHNDPNSDFDHFLIVLNNKKETLGPFVVTIKGNDGIEGMLIGRIDRENMATSFGYKRILSFNLRCLNIIYGGVLLRTLFDEYDRLLDFIRTECKCNQIDIISFNMLSCEDPLRKTIISRYRWPSREIFARTQRHFQININSPFESYFSSLSKNTRKNYRNYKNKFEKEFSGRFEIVKYSDCDVDELMDHCFDIHKKTYKKGLGVGIRDVDLTKRRFELAVAKGWNKSYILFIDDRPAAYQLGFVYADVYFGMGKGFDPLYTKYRIGTYLLVKMLKDLFNKEKLENVDFGFGMAEYKEIFGNTFWEESTTYIYPKTKKGIYINSARTLVAAFDHYVRTLIKKLSVESRIKNIWRKKLT